MVKDLVGYRFYPTGEELINYYLKNKIHGKTWLVDEAISEINICSYEPMFLPSLSKIKSEDPVWYFFSPKEYTTAKKKVTKRTTSGGYWKATGVDRKIKDKRGNRGEIGIKKTLVYYEGRVPNGVWTPWVMHEYHITCLPLDQRNYVICQVMYKGEDGDVPSGGNNSSEPSQSFVSDLNTVGAFNTAPAPEPVVQQAGEENFYGLSVDDLRIPISQQKGLSLSDVFNNPNTLNSDYNYNISPYVQPQTYDAADDDYIKGLLNFNGGNYEDVLPYQELMMLENRNEHRPKKAVSGIIVDSSSDNSSDAESISGMSYQETSSPGSPIRHLPSCSSTDSCKDLQTSADPSISRKTRKSQLTRRSTIPSKQMKEGGSSKAIVASTVKESSMVKTEKKSWFITEEAVERNSKNPRYIYLIKLIIGFILLLALIGNIISDLVTVKT